ncbi:Putative transporter [Tolypocladium paradoxum]|uniref:Transporter n=1 Tax=Tolypocladium paradoxum TaxID=94208 RepID=A0A2S4L857_9HYPO|nr:Putative transporter [Tolypocladium paradoxum]
MASAGTFPAPTSFRLSKLAQDAYDYPMRVFQAPPEAHPSVPHLCLLVFEAVLEVVCVSLPGYIIARLGHFDADKQKFLANLNVMLFTPCLIFTKLASQLNADKLSDLAIIPAIFVVQTLVSWMVSTLVAKAFRFNRRASNFVTAMGVFGNSNSLPISLVLSLSQTIKGLHWDRIPGDNDDEVGARGILYLLIFQQLGQLVRWSWGYHVLLAPKDKYPEYEQQIAEEGQYRYAEDHDEDEAQGLIDGLDGDTEDDEDRSVDSRTYVPAGRTPVVGTSRASMADSSDDDEFAPKKPLSNGQAALKANQPAINGNDPDNLAFPRIGSENGDMAKADGAWARAKLSVAKRASSLKCRIARSLCRLYQHLPRPLQLTLSFLATVGRKLGNFVWEFMNPPLWAMLIAVLVASIPALQTLFFEDGSFVNNSVTNAVKSSGGVAVPLILVVLGANLARNTMAHNDDHDPEEDQIGTKLLVASLLSRMLLPTLIMAPILAVTAKYLPISILDDPIFIVVCFLLTGAPSALQLAQICQINNVYEKTMGRILFQSYVIWILPSTLVLVIMALEVVEWAA